MPSKTLAFLKKLLHPVLRILGMTEGPQNFEEFPYLMSVGDWAHSLVSKYTSRDPKLGPKYRVLMPNLHVARIRHYKEQGAPRHEYLVAEIVISESEKGYPEKRYLRLERVADDTISSGSSHSSLALSNNLYALDIVKTITGWPSDPCIEYLNCENLPQPITLLDLALAAETVHNDSERYQVMSRQCFWYADTVSGILET